MPGDVQANPEELERFAKELKEFNQQLGERMKSLNGKFQRLNNTWRDSEQKQFAQEYTQTMKTLQRFIQSSEKQIPLLQRKAKALREYFAKR